MAIFVTGDVHGGAEYGSSRFFDAPARLADAGEPCPQLVEAHRCAGVGVHAHVDGYRT